MALLDDKQITDGLELLEGWEWRPEDAEIRRTVVMPDFMSVVHLVEAIAHAAEQAGHHPDMDIRYNRLTLHQTTHAAGGVTEADFALAARMDELIADAQPRGGSGEGPEGG
ncbi:4a-hydroxytetrahydrobiopterin dehydratase [Nocardiopsis sp. RSe5-2]|uniref:Putative pterin-4-alpha-carbinolamine dehydratase n=1 Tax=Nocardiopsis endophytica TaxID=3018445 RepID=A0ABT4UDG8_9ACTN|nr:4a-hydroxytetrahydrobiopterin dehydratase [Nocardiopsis endophytica]MDA2815028.1 4a-hydroxytetrahydrobiopterin dehydratase [Nocardiopsis endophytica]